MSTNLVIEMGFPKHKVTGFNRVLKQHWHDIGGDVSRAIQIFLDEEYEEDENSEMSVEENKIEKMKKIDSNLMNKSFKHCGSRSSLMWSYTESEMASVTGKLLKQFALDKLSEDPIQTIDDLQLDNNKK
jgi:hypothetical protein